MSNKDRIDKLEKIVIQNSEQISELYKISSKQNGFYVALENKVKAQDNDHVRFEKMLVDIKESLDNLQGLSDFFKGAGLLKKPLMILIAFIIGLVTLIGGIKSLLTFFLPIK